MTVVVVVVVVAGSSDYSLVVAAGGREWFRKQWLVVAGIVFSELALHCQISLSEREDTGRKETTAEGITVVKHWRDCLTFTKCKMQTPTTNMQNFDT